MANYRRNDGTRYEESQNFLHFYQTFKCLEKDLAESDIKMAEVRRKNLTLGSYMACTWLGDVSASYVLENALDNYTKIIDNKEDVNNYAEFITSSAATSQHNGYAFTLLDSNIHTHPTDIDKYAFRAPKSIPSVLDPCDTEFNSLSDFLSFTASKDEDNEGGIITRNKSSSRTSDSIEARRILSRYKDPYSITCRNRKSASVCNTNTTDQQNRSFGFRTARDEQGIRNFRIRGAWRNNNGTSPLRTSLPTTSENGTSAPKRSLGTTGPSLVFNKFVSPVIKNEGEDQPSENDTSDDPRLKNIDKNLVELIKNEIMDQSSPIHWDDIAGLEFVKNTIKEVVVLPMLRPDIFTGIRCPPKGILLFGPPGTGKTLIGKCVASQVKSTFFSISASSLTSKWVGEGEKMVRALFAVARCYQPSVIFIDEIDSLLCQRSNTEHESSRRLKTEFLVQLDGAATNDSDRILLIGATNRPQELDEAARRRFVKRLYIPLPDFEARCRIISRMMENINNDLSHEHIQELGRLADGYSGADMATLCREASLGPIRSLDMSRIETISLDEVRAVGITDFKSALDHVRASVSQSDLGHYLQWDNLYGSCGAKV